MESKETLEEVAKTHAFNFYEKEDRKVGKQSFIEGAKWQKEPEQFFNDDRVKTLEKGIEYLLKRQERMYSEEEVIGFLIKREYALDLYDMANDYEDANKWLNNLKRNKMKQTSIEWLYKNLLDNPLSNEDVIYNINVFEQAKEMHRQEIIECGNSCAIKQHLHNDKVNKMSMDEMLKFAEEETLTFGEQYYNETYNK